MDNIDHVMSSETQNKFKLSIKDVYGTIKKKKELSKKSLNG